MAFVEIVTVHGTADPLPYTGAETADIQYAQSGNTLYMVHPNHPPAKVTKYSAVDWRYEILPITNGPYMSPTDGDDLIQLSLSSVTDYVTLRAPTGTTPFTGLTTSMYVEYPLSGRWVIGKFVSATSATEIIVECVEERCFVPSKEVYCRGVNTNNATPALFAPTAPVTVSGGTSPIFTNSFVVTRDVVGNFLRFTTEDGTVYWMQVTAAVTSAFSSSSYGQAADGDVLQVIKPAQAVTRIKREILGVLSSSASGFFSITNDVGRWYRLNFDSKTVNAKMVMDGANTTTAVKVTMSSPVPIAVDKPADTLRRSGTNDWLRGSFYNLNYPATITLHEQRLILAGTNAEPNALWMSKTGDYSDFATTDYESKVLDDSGITLTLASATLNEIYWVVSRGALLVGTAGGEWSVGASQQREAITPTTVKAEQESSYGSVYTQAVVAARSIMFLQGGGRRLREVTYDASSSGYLASDATVFAEHILRDHANGTQVAYQQLPDSSVYVVCGDGQVAVLTYEPDQKVYAWSRFISGGNAPIVKSLAVDQTGASNTVYMVVTRTVNGVPFSTIETLRSEYNPTSDTDKDDMIFLDCYQDIPLGSLVSNAIVAASLLPYLGQLVSVLIDNVEYAGLTCPVSGDLTLPATPATRVVIGYAYESVVETLPMDLPSPQGTSQAKTKRINQIAFRLHQSLYLEHGPVGATTLRPLNPGNPGYDPAGTDPLFTGDVRVPFDGGFDGRAQIKVSTSRALPLTLLAIYPEVTQTQ